MCLGMDDSMMSYHNIDNSMMSNPGGTNGEPQSDLSEALMASRQTAPPSQPQLKKTLTFQEQV